ncbi:MAG: serine/threonine protein kinase [Cyanobacteria bacterium]|nr:serine/threonine protein kinase [Cyanobacteriota bacterium]
MPQNETPGRIGEQYKVIKKIGQGGMGAVYKAVDEYLDRPVAIKMLLTTDLSGEEFARFQREAQASGKLNHPHIIRTLDFGVSHNGHPYLVMEFLEGVSLSSILKREAPMSLQRAEYFVSQIASALQYSHKNGVIHRDLKPSNIMVVKNADGDLVAKLVDFGLAQIKDNQQNLTLTGFGIGSPLYMAPEQVKGHKADERADIYALGCLIFQMIAGKLPIQDEVVFETMTRKCEETAPLLSEVIQDKPIPPRLDELVAKCLEIDRDNRFSGMTEFQSSAQSAFGNRATLDMDIPSRPQPATKRKHNVATIIGAASLIIISGILIYGIMTDEPRKADEVREEIKEKKIAEASGDFFVDKIPEQVVKFRFQNETSCQTVRPSPVKDEDLKELVEHPELHSLKLDTARVTGVGLRYLYPLKIEELKMSSTHLNDEGMRTLGGLKHLKDLNLAHCVGITNEGLKSITNLKLWRLSLKDTPIDDQCLKTIARMTHLTHLDLSECANITPTGLTYLSSSPKLRELRLGGKSTSVAMFEALNKVSQLQGVSIELLEDHDTLASGLKALANLPNLTQVELAKLHTPDDLGLLLRPLKNQFGLTLVNSELNSRGLQSLADADKLTRLTISQSNMSCEDLKALCKLNQVSNFSLNVEDGTPSELESSLQHLKASLPKSNIRVNN